MFCGLALFRSSHGSRGGATCKGSIPHLEKPKVRILDYPMMGESVRRLLAADGRCMKEELLSIGEFAKLRGVSVKSLRYYERVGALKPAYVNEESGYRYYSINQISDLDMVTTFIELGVPLKEMASTAALGYGQSELIEKGASWRGSASGAPRHSFCSSTATPTRSPSRNDSNQRSAMSANLPSDFCCARRLAAISICAAMLG